MKIIAGKYKNSRIELSKKVDFRPTKSSTREAIFSILSSGSFIDYDKSIIENAKVLDLFAGSGSYSFEALSRGAKNAIVIDTDQNNIDMIIKNKNNLDIKEEIITIRCDATALPKAQIKCDLVFIDPPYNNNALEKTLTSLKNQHWLNDKTIIIVEQSIKTEYIQVDNFTLITEKIYGKTKIRIMKYHE